MFEPIPIEVFRQRTEITSDFLTKGWSRADKIVSLRNIAKVIGLQAMPVDYLKKLLINVTIQGDESEKIYKDCKITTMRMDPVNLVVGQTFIERPKYIKFLERFGDIFSDFCVTRGVAKCTALIALCEMHNKTFGIAHYLPPIVEENNGRLCLLDGVHRNFLVKAVGTTLETIIIKNVPIKFPCDLQEWGSVKIVDKKPPPEERFFNLKPELFRNLKTIGIDG